MSDHEDDLLDEMIDTTMTAMADAFRELWARDGARQLLESWLAGTAVFVVARDEVTVLVRPDPVVGP